MNENKRGLGLHFKLMAATSLVLILIFVLIGFLAVETEKLYFREQVRRKAILSLNALHTITSQAFQARRFDLLRKYLSTLPRNDPDMLEAEVYDRMGRLAFRMFPRPSFRDRTGSIRLERTFYVNRVMQGRVRIAYRPFRMESTVRRIASILLAGLLAALLLVALTIHLAVKHLVSNPLGDFISTAGKITSGELSERIGLDHRGDEIGDLSRAFNLMVSSLEASLAEIEEINQRLESRVEERTRELALQQAKTRNIIESLADALVTVDRKGLVTYWNHAAERLTGIDSSLATGKPVGDVLRVVSRSGEDVLEQLLASSNPARPEEGRLEVDGRSVPVLLACAPLESPKDGRLFGSVLTIRDMSRLHELNEQLKRSDRLSSLGVLAAGVAHELNNPLGNISTFAQLSCERLEQGSPPSPSWLRTIQKEVARASNIVTGLLEFSRREPPSFTLFDLRDVMRSCRELVVSTLTRHDVTLNIAEPEVECPVHGDKNQLQQVFINLIANGAQAMYPEGGQIDVEIERKEGSHPAYEISVADRGPGISAENRDKIFNPFFTTKDVGEGTGLGLSVSYGIIQEHGGDIDFRDRRGGGTVFVVRLPVPDVEPAVEEH